MDVRDSWIKSDGDGGLMEVAMDATIVATKKQAIVARLMQHVTSLLELPEDSALSLEKDILYGTRDIKESNDGDRGSSATGGPSTGSMALPGTVKCKVAQDVMKFQGKNPLCLEVAFNSACIHWMWQEQESSSATSPARPLSCLMTILAKEGVVGLRSGENSTLRNKSPSESATSKSTTPSINLEGIQISLEQQDMEETGESSTRLFVRLDTVDWIHSGQVTQLSVSDLTLSGIILPSGPVNRMTIQQAHLTCPQTSVLANATPVEVPAMTRTAKTSTMVDMIATRNADRDNHVFLSALLKVFNAIDAPHSSITNHVPVIVTITSNGSDFYQQQELLPPFGTPSPTTTTLGTLIRYLYLHMQDTAISIAKLANDDHGNKGTAREHEVDGKNGSKKQFRFAVGDSLAATAGLVATGASYVSPLGAAVSVAAVGVKDGVVAAAEVGKRERGVDSENGYRFGDVTRGVISTVQQRRQQRHERAESSSDSNHDESDGRQSFLHQNKARYAGVIGGSVGAAVGLSLVGGPLGLVAGSLLGSHATQNHVSKRNGGNTDQSAAQDLASHGAHTMDGVSANDVLIMQQLNRPGCLESRPQASSPQRVRADNSHPPIAAAVNPSSTSTYQGQEHTPYRLGDNIRGVLARGKAADGRGKDSEYKFGDFTRGLFVSSRRTNSDG